MIDHDFISMIDYQRGDSRKIRCHWMLAEISEFLWVHKVDPSDIEGASLGSPKGRQG